MFRLRNGQKKDDISEHAGLVVQASYCIPCCVLLLYSFTGSKRREVIKNIVDKSIGHPTRKDELLDPYCPLRAQIPGLPPMGKATHDRGTTVEPEGFRKAMHVMFEVLEQSRSYSGRAKVSQNETSEAR